MSSASSARSGRLGPPTSKAELKQRQNRDALAKLMSSSASALERFEATGAELQRAVSESERTVRALFHK